jgi:hypothetical protein
MLSKTRTFLLAANLAAAPAVCAFSIGDNRSEAVSLHTGASDAMTDSGAARDSTTDTGARSHSNSSTYLSPSRRSGEQVGDFERSDRVATN